MSEQRRTSFGYLGAKGELHVTLENGVPIIRVIDKRFANTRTAGIALSSKQMRSLGVALCSIARGEDFNEINIEGCNQETHTTIATGAKT